MAKTAMAGIMESTTPARTTEMEHVPRLPWRETRPSGSVKFWGEVSKTNGRKNSFQW